MKKILMLVVLASAASVVAGPLARRRVLTPVSQSVDTLATPTPAASPFSESKSVGVADVTSVARPEASAIALAKAEEKREALPRPEAGAEVRPVGNANASNASPNTTSTGAQADADRVKNEIARMAGASDIDLAGRSEFLHKIRKIDDEIEEAFTKIMSWQQEFSKKYNDVETARSSFVQDFDAKRIVAATAYQEVENYYKTQDGSSLSPDLKKMFDELALKKVEMFNLLKVISDWFVAYEEQFRKVSELGLIVAHDVVAKANKILAQSDLILNKALNFSAQLDYAMLVSELQGYKTNLTDMLEKQSKEVESNFSSALAELEKIITSIKENLQKSVGLQDLLKKHVMALGEVKKGLAAAKEQVFEQKWQESRLKALSLTDSMPAEVEIVDDAVVAPENAWLSWHFDQEKALAFVQKIAAGLLLIARITWHLIVQVSQLVRWAAEQAYPLVTSLWTKTLVFYQELKTKNVTSGGVSVVAVPSPVAMPVSAATAPVVPASNVAVDVAKPESVAPSAPAQVKAPESPAVTATTAPTADQSGAESASSGLAGRLAALRARRR